jgi:hypothetical protein
MHIRDHWTARIARNAPGEEGAGATPADPQAEPAAPDYSWAPEQFLSEGAFDGQAFRAAWDEQGAELGQLREQMEAARAGIPETPDAYEFSAPETIDFGEIEVPEGFQFAIDPEAPVLPELRQWLHDNGVKSEAVQGLMGIMAKQEAHELSRFTQQAKAEIQSLGPQAEQRVGKLRSALQTIVPNQAEALMKATVTADAFRALETLVNRANGGGTPRPQPSTPDLSSMNPIDRLAHVLAKGSNAA